MNTQDFSFFLTRNVFGPESYGLADAYYSRSRNTETLGQSASQSETRLPLWSTHCQRILSLLVLLMV